MNISAIVQGLGIPQSNLPFPFQRIGVALVPEPEKYARTSGKCFGDGKGTSPDVAGSEAGFEQGTPVAWAGGNWIVAVGIPIEADTLTAGENTPKKSAAAERNSEEIVAILTGSSVHQGRSRSGGVFARAVEVGCNRAGS